MNYQQILAMLLRMQAPKPNPINMQPVQHKSTELPQPNEIYGVRG